MQLTNNYQLKKPDGTDVVNIDDFNNNADILDNVLKAHDTQLSESTNILIPTNGSTANAVLLNIPSLANNRKYSFKASAVSTGNVTINGKAFKKSDGTQIGSGGVKANKVYDFYYDSVTDSVFILAKAEGDATDADVLAGKIYSNGDDIGRTGGMTNNNIPSTSLPINGTYTIPKGFHPGTEVVNQNVTTKGSATIIPGTTDQVISPNQYLLGAQTVKGDSNLVPDNIIKGKSIFNIAGSAKRMASGSGVTPSTTGYNYPMYDAGGTVNMFPITVTGLNFKPSLVVVISYNSSNVNQTVMTVYDATVDPYRGAAVLRSSIYANKDYGTGWSYLIHADTAPLPVVFEGGFNMPVFSTFAFNCRWFACE